MSRHRRRVLCSVKDDYGVIDAEAEVVLDKEFTPEGWSAVADELARRLEALPKGQGENDFHRSYERDQISNWLIDALDKAGRGDETGKIYEDEARRTNSYERLGQLLEAATEAGCREEVRTQALLFLETGGWPKSMIVASGKGEDGTTEWPLPTPDYLLPLLQSPNKRRSKNGPRYDVLIDMAIAEKSPDEVLKWYDKLCASQSYRGPGSFGYGLDDYSKRVAEAVAESHPQRSLDIYRQQVEINLTQAKQSAYEAVAAYLRKMRPILKSLHRQDEWTKLLADIRLRYRNRPRFIEILDRLEGRQLFQMPELIVLTRGLMPNDLETSVDPQSPRKGIVSI